MKTPPLHKFKRMLAHVCLFLMGLPFVWAKTLVSIPAPMFALKDVDGDYRVELENMRDTIEQGKNLECYQAASMFEKKMRANKRIRAIEGREQVTKEDLMARDWLLYYITITPPLALKEYMRLEKSQQLDIDFKYTAGVILIQRSPSGMAKLLGQNEKMLEARYTAWTQAIMTGFFQINKETEPLYTQQCALLKELQDNPPKDAYPGFDEEWLVWKTQQGRILNTLDRISNRREQSSQKIESFGIFYARKIVEAFPNNGARVQETLMKSGFSTKEKCRDILIKAVGSDKKTEYLFRGLPPLEKPKNKKERK